MSSLFEKKTTPMAAVAALSFLAAYSGAQGQQLQTDFRAPLAKTSYSGSASTPGYSEVSSAADEPATPHASGVQRPPRPITAPAFQPFSSAVVTLKATSTGVGFDVALPVASWLALRSGASYFSYNTTVTTSGLNINGALHLQNAATSLDFHPFRNAFRISPGLSYANHVAMNASVMVPGGQSFSLGDSGDYTSDPSNPIHGTGSFVFGNRVNPRITMGFANILSHRSGRFGMPVEVGFQYTAAPTVKLVIMGNACASTIAGTGCGPVDQTYVAQEQQQLQSDLEPARFYPLVSVGFSYRFGHVSQNR